MNNKIKLYIFLIALCSIAITLIFYRYEPRESGFSCGNVDAIPYSAIELNDNYTADVVIIISMTDQPEKNRLIATMKNSADDVYLHPARDLLLSNYMTVTAKINSVDGKIMVGRLSRYVPPPKNNNKNAILSLAHHFLNKSDRCELSIP